MNAIPWQKLEKLIHYPPIERSNMTLNQQFGQIKDDCGGRSPVGFISLRCCRIATSLDTGI
jgi:hypothetical protein